MNISTLCTPALVYLIISSVAILFLFAQQFTIMTVLVKVGWTFLWTWLLNYICSKGYTTVSWIMVALPYVVMFGILALVLEFTNTINGYLSITIISSTPKYTSAAMPSMMPSVTTGHF